jgi:hypothetical protein
MHSPSRDAEHRVLECKAQVLALIGLRARKRLVRDNVALIEANLAAARAFFERHFDSFEFHEPAAGSVAFPRLCTGEPVQDFCQRLVESAGARISPPSLREEPQAISCEMIFSVTFNALSQRGRPYLRLIFEAPG